MITHGLALLYTLLLATHHDTEISLSKSTSEKDPLDWLIVGGGPHGVALAARLAAKGITHFAIVDDSAQLLDQWKRRTKATGMKYMRSAATFHLDVEKNALRNFAIAQQTRNNNHPKQATKKAKTKRTKIKDNSKLFASDYERPSLELFNQHCDHVLEKYRLHERHLKARVEGIDLPDDDGMITVNVVVSGSSPTKPLPTHSTLRARNVVLALGSDDPSIPEWARQANYSIPHILETQQQDELAVALPAAPAPASSSSSSTDTTTRTIPRVAIVGGGISAVHKALEIAHKYKTTQSSTFRDEDTPLVHIISRHEIYEQQFDTHQDWMMDDDAVRRSLQAGGSGLPKCLADFRQLKSYAARRKVIQQARRPGTVPPSLSRQGLREAMEANLIEWHVGDIHAVQRMDDHEQIRIDIMSNTKSTDSPTRSTIISTSTTTQTIMVDQVLLATGFGKRPAPGWDTLLAPLVVQKAPHLPVSPLCGYPLVDAHLQWSSSWRLYVTGALAELELGPSARNLAGARMAAERIVGPIN